MSKPIYRKLSRLSLTAKLLRGIAALLEKWPLLLITFLIVSPITPHMLTRYSGGEEHYCQYIGVHGAVSVTQTSPCTFVTFIRHQPL